MLESNSGNAVTAILSEIEEIATGLVMERDNLSVLAATIDYYVYEQSQLIYSKDEYSVMNINGSEIRATISNIQTRLDALNNFSEAEGMYYCLNNTEAYRENDINQKGMIKNYEKLCVIKNSTIPTAFENMSDQLRNLKLLYSEYIVPFLSKDDEYALKIRTEYSKIVQTGLTSDMVFDANGNLISYDLVQIECILSDFRADEISDETYAMIAKAFLVMETDDMTKVINAMMIEDGSRQYSCAEKVWQ